MAWRCPTRGQTMPADRSKTSTRNSPTSDAVVITASRIFPDGVIDLVASEDPCRPNLVFWDGNRAKIAPRIRHGDLWYQAPELRPSIGRTIRLPDRVGRRGSAPQLFDEISALFQEYLGLPPDVAQQLAMWTASTWVSDQLASPPALIIVGPNMRRAADLFELLACGSRRALGLTGINRAALVGLPMDLNLTLLISQPDLSRSLLQLLNAANHRGVHVPGTNGAILDWAGSRAIFLGSTASPNSWSGESLWISLPVSETELPLLDEQARDRITQDLQAKFLRFRLDWLWKAHDAGLSVGRRPFPGNELAQSLSACAWYEPELMETVTPALRGLVDEAAARLELEAESVVLEVIWEPAHQLPELRQMKITEYLNLKLRTRGGHYEYSNEEVGWILKGHGFEKDRNGSGMILRFSGNNTRLLHRLVRTLGLDLPEMPGCTDCTGPDTIVAHESV
jgi:hypothetical protein